MGLIVVELAEKHVMQKNIKCKDAEHNIFCTRVIIHKKCGLILAKLYDDKIAYIKCYDQ